MRFSKAWDGKTGVKFDKIRKKPEAKPVKKGKTEKTEGSAE